MARELLPPKTKKPTAAATALYERLRKSINPAYIRLVLRAADALRADICDDAGIRAELRSNRLTASVADTDLETLVFMVLMEAVRDAEADMKAVLEDVQRTTEQKEALRRTLDEQQELNARSIRGYKRPDPIAESEQSELQSLRLQLITDRMTKTLSVLSNLLKKVNDTANDTIRNLK